MAKFKVGDMVRVRKDIKNLKCSYGLNPRMIGMAGELHRISHAYIYEDSYWLEKTGAAFIWTENLLESASQESIHISCDGDTVHAVYKRDGKIVKRSKAVCDPKDEFDFTNGAGRSFGRLMGVDVTYNGQNLTDKPAPAPEPIKFNFEEFMAGKFVVNCKTEQEADVFLAYLHGRGVKWSSGASLQSFNSYKINKHNTCYSHIGRDVFGNVGLEYCNIRWVTEKEPTPIIPFKKEDL